MSGGTFRVERVWKEEKKAASLLERKEAKWERSERPKTRQGKGSGLDRCP